MYLESLNFQGLRNLVAATLHFSPKFNLFWGNNGSGKTSLLEAIHLLATGRSFRSTSAVDYINFDQPLCNLFAKSIIAARHRKGVSHNSGYPKDLGCEESMDSSLNSSPEAFQVGLERHKTEGTTIRINQQRCATLAELARILPLQLINTHTYSLLEGSSRFRRQFLDWGMFHVKHSFFPAWQRYAKALKQRNAALKRVKQNGIESVVAWDNELAEQGQILDDHRQEFISRFKPLLTMVMTEFLVENTNIAGNINTARNIDIARNVNDESINKETNKSVTIEDHNHPPTIMLKEFNEFNDDQNHEEQKQKSSVTEVPERTSGSNIPNPVDPADTSHPMLHFTLNYKRGWKEDLTLAEALKASLELDMIRGYTGQGPHRADLQFLINSNEAENVLSRGQQKLLICALFIARSEWFYQHTKHHGIFLLDDLTSELDKHSSRWLLMRLKEMGGQVLLTAIEPDWVINFMNEELKLNSGEDNFKMFHVERGRISY